MLVVPRSHLPSPYSTSTQNDATAARVPAFIKRGCHVSHPPNGINLGF